MRLIENYEIRIRLIWYLIIIFYLLAISLLFINNNIWGDERHFIETIRYFASHSFIESVRDYQEVTPPLFYAIFSWWGKIVGLSLLSLRLFNLLIAFCSLLVLFEVVRQYFEQLKVSLLLCIALLFNPYMIGLSIFVFTDMLTFFFFLSAVYYFNKNKIILFSILSSAAILCRQYSIILISAAVLFTCQKIYYHIELKKNVKYLFFYFLSLIPLFFMMLIWKNIAPPSGIAYWTNNEKFTWNPSAFITYIAFILIYLLPVMVLLKINIFKNWKLVVTGVIGGLLYLIFGILPSKATVLQGTYDTVGIVHRIIKYVTINNWGEHAFFLLAASSGFLFLFLIIRDDYLLFKQKKKSIVSFTSLVIYSFLLIMPFSYQIWEKYLLLILPFAAVKLVKLKLNTETV